MRKLLWVVPIATILLLLTGPLARGQDEDFGPPNPQDLLSGGSTLPIRQSLPQAPVARLAPRPRRGLVLTSKSMPHSSPSRMACSVALKRPSGPPRMGSTSWWVSTTPRGFADLPLAWLAHLKARQDSPVSLSLQTRS